MGRRPVIDVNRRRLLTALLLAPWLAGAPARAASPARRIVALEWLPLEMLFALGVTPLAAASPRDYALWVREPPLPAGVIDVGQRTEPNLERIAQLAPDLIVYSQGYGPRAAQLDRIAPAMAFDFTDARGRPLQTVRDGLMALARRLDRMEQAKAHLAYVDSRFSEARAALASYRRQPLLVFSLIDEHHAVILTDTSLFGNVMTELGIDNGWRGENSFWGTAEVGIERLATLPPMRAICLDHGDGDTRARIAATALWQVIPFVRQSMLRTVPAVWFFGATLAALRFCHMLEALEHQW